MLRFPPTPSPAARHAPPAPAPASPSARYRSPRPVRRPGPHLHDLDPSSKPHPIAAPPPVPCGPASRSSSVSPTHRIGVNPPRLRRRELRRHHRVGLAVQLAPLRMPDDHVAAAEFRQHRRRNFAGKGALRVLAQVLRAPRERAALQPAPPLRRDTETARRPRIRRLPGLRFPRAPHPAAPGSRPGCRAFSSCRRRTGCACQSLPGVSRNPLNFTALGVFCAAIRGRWIHARRLARKLPLPHRPWCRAMRLRRVRAGRKAGPRAHATPELGRLLAVQREHLAQAAAPAPAAVSASRNRCPRVPGGEDPVGEIEPAVRCAGGAAARCARRESPGAAGSRRRARNSRSMSRASASSARRRPPRRAARRRRAPAPRGG